MHVIKCYCRCPYRRSNLLRIVCATAAHPRLPTPGSRECGIPNCKSNGKPKTNQLLSQLPQWYHPLSPCVNRTRKRQSVTSHERVAHPPLEVLSKVAGVGVGIFAWLATAPATAPASIDEAPHSQTVPDAQNSSKSNTRNKHTNKHSSRTSDKLRKRETWDDKKFGRKGNQKRGNDHNDSN